MKKSTIENIVRIMALISTVGVGFILWSNRGLLFGIIGAITSYFIVYIFGDLATKLIYRMDLFDGIDVEKNIELPSVWKKLTGIQKWIVSFILLLVLLGIISIFLHTEEKFYNFLKTIIIVTVLIGVGILFLSAKENEYIENRGGVKTRVVINPGSSIIIVGFGMILLILAIIISFWRLLAIFNVDLLSVFSSVEDWTLNNSTIMWYVKIVAGIILYGYWYFTILQEELDSYYGGIFGLLKVIIFPFVGAALLTGFIVIFLYIAFLAAVDIFKSIAADKSLWFI